MQTRRPITSLLAVGALACAGAFFTLSAQAQGAYFAVVPVSGVGAVGQLRPVKIALAGAMPPAATVGVPYEFNLRALLSLDGPDGTSPSKVVWSILSGELPAGLDLAGGIITGVPAETAASKTVVIRAEYQDSRLSAEAMREYAFEIHPAGIADYGGYRAWADGTFAQSCNEYLRPAAVGHAYAGATGDGVYRIAPASIASFDVPCDMNTDGGGWTLVEYAADLPFVNRWTSGDAWRWVPQDFSLKISDTQIDAIRSVSKVARQQYVGLCRDVIHYYRANDYDYAVGFRYHTGLETSSGSATYTPSTIKIVQDGCKANELANGSLEQSTIFEIEDINLPVTNIRTRDSGEAGEFFGSPLTHYPARFR